MSTPLMMDDPDSECYVDAPSTQPSTAPFPSLTPREREIALRLAIGDRNADIAESIGISVKTIDTHRGHILKKLSCRHNVDLCLLAVRAGYIK